VVSTDNF